MKLSFEQIQKITKGAARIERDEGKIKFYRFTEEQEKLYFEDKLYSEPDKAFYKKSLSALHMGSEAHVICVSHSGAGACLHAIACYGT